MIAEHVIVTKPLVFLSAILLGPIRPAPIVLHGGQRETRIGTDDNEVCECRSAAVQP
jgi:hypothetical protein